MPSFIPDVKNNSWGCILHALLANRVIFLVEQKPIGWNTFSESYTRKTDWPQTLLGKSILECSFDTILCIN